MTAAGPGKLASEPADPVAGSPPGPRPWRSVLVCLLATGLVVALGRDLAASASGVQSASGIAGRIAADPFRLALVGATFAALLYVFFQLAGLRADGQALTGTDRATRPRLVLRRVAGRPAAAESESWGPAEAHVVAEWGGDAIAGPLRLGVTAFPMIGFLGTVIGLSGAIEALPRAMNDEEALGEVLGSLHVAFDTTLLGLVGALVCLVGARMIDETVDALTRRVDDAG